MNTPHTPGPWHVEHPYGEAGTYISSPDTTLVAKVYNERDAKLLAAAPELLATLNRLEEAVSAHLSQPVTITNLNELGDAQDEARAAIAKATTHQTL